jgi:hypothetical protein
VFKKLIKISYSVLAVFVGLLLLAYVLFSSFAFQNYITTRISHYVNDKYHTRISIGEISYDGWSYFSLRKVMMGDTKSDTLFYAGRLQFNLAGIQIDSLKFKLNHVVLDEGLCKITTYKDSTFSFDAINAFMDPNDTIPPDPNAPPFVLELKNLECMDTRFIMIDSTEEFYKEGYDPFNMLVTDINFRSRNFQIIEDSLHFDLHNFTCKEKSGFEIKRLEAIAMVSATSIRLDKMEMVTKHSVLRNYFSLDYKSWKDYADFENKVKFNLKLKDCDVDFKDIVYFAPFLKEYDYKARVSGLAKGPLANLHITNIKASHGKDTYFEGNARLSGLPDIKQTFMDIEAEYASSNSAEIQTISGVDMPEILNELGKIVYKGRYTGFYTDFVSFGDVETRFGNIKTDLNMKLPENVMDASYSGSVQLSHFDIGSFLKNNSLGLVSLSGSVQGKGFDLEHLNSQFDITASEFDFNKYKYSEIDINATASNKKIETVFDINDSNLIFSGEALVNMAKPFKYIKVNSVLEDANPDALHFISGVDHLGFDINSDFYFKDLDENYGTIDINNTHYEKNAYSYRISNLTLTAQNGNEKMLSLKGDYVDAFIKGQYNFDYLYEQVYNMVAGVIPNYIAKKNLKQYPEQDFTFKLELYSTQNISPLFFPGYNATQVDLKGQVRSANNTFLVQGGIGSLNADGLIFNANTLKFLVNEKKELNLLYGAKSIGKKDTLFVGDVGLKFDGFNNVGEAVWFIRDSNSIVNAEFEHAIKFNKGDEIVADIHSGVIGKGAQWWNLNEGELLMLKDNILYFQELILQRNKQQVKVDGLYALSGNKKNISLSLTDFDLAAIQQFIPDLGVKPGGLTDGFLIYKNIGRHEVIIGDMVAKNLSLDNDTLGSFKINTGYNEEEEKVLITVQSSDGKIKNLKGVGYYDIMKDAIDFEISFLESELNSFQAFVKDYVKILDGKGALNGHLYGKISNPKFEGSLVLNQAAFRIEYLKTVYHFKQANLNFNQQSIDIVPFDILDVNNKRALVSGSIKHNGFNQFKYNLHLDDIKSFQFLNTTSKDNDLFYGQAYASGSATITGNTNNVMMSVKAKSEKNTQIIINPFGGESESGDGIINFIDHDTTFSISGKNKAIPFGFGITLDIEGTPDAEVQMLFSAQSDDKIRAKGRGKVKLTLTPEGNFFMNGKYELSDGEYRFSAMNVVAKKFLLKPGSTVEWNGDPLAGKLDIVGIYKLRTTVSEIVNNSASADPNVRIPVECIINIKGTVVSPQIGFDLNFPDLQSNLNGSAASELGAVLNNFRREPDLMNQQIVFLLISGKFIPLTNSNNNVAGSFGSQTVSDLLSKQAAGLLNKLDPSLDLTVDMLNATDPTKGRQFLILASRRFLDNRLEVQGSFSTDNSQNNFSASYNIRKNGNLKAKVFNKNGFDPIYSRNIATSGLGLYYRKEFDHIYELFRKQNTFNY